MAFKFRKALAFALAAAMVVTAAPSTSITADAAAKKPSITKSKTINADKTASIKVNTVKKGRFIKITSISKAANVTIKAKIGKKTKTLKKNKYYKVTGKSVTLKVTGKDAIADYTSTIKVSVFDKKGKKYNVVKPKNLTAKVKVKASEFSITNVVSTVDAGWQGSKYIRATFSKAIDSLDASEVEISNKATGQIFSVAKVALAKNGKSVDVTLVGDDSANSVNWLQPNTSYIFKITKSGVTGQFEFSIPDVVGEKVVTATNAKEKTITANGVVLNVPDSIKVDYEDILGRRITAKFDKTNTITNLTVADEEVVYAAVKGNADGYYEDVVSKKKYYLTKPTDTADGTFSINRLTKAATESTVANEITGNTIKNDNFAYARIVLNSAKKISSISYVANWSGNILVGSVNGNTVANGKTEKSLKDYKIVKDGKSVEVSSIQKDDVVFYSAANQEFAVVYNNTVTGKITNVFKGRFELGGKTYDESLAPLKYFDDELKAVDDDVMGEFKASNADVKVYLDWRGYPVYITGTRGAEETSTKTYALIKNALAGTADAQVIDFEGVNSSTGKVEKFSVKVSDLTSVETDTLNSLGSYEYKVSKKYSNQELKKFVNTGAAGAAPDLHGIYDNNGVTATVTGSVLTGASHLAQLKVVEFKVDKSDKIIGIKRTVAKVAGAVDGGANDFKYGAKTIGTGNTDGSMLKDSTKIYVITKTANLEAGEMFTFDKFTDKVKAAAIGNIRYYVNSNNEVTSVVIDKVAAGNNYEGNGEAGDKYTAVVSNCETDKDGKVVSITLATANGVGTPITSFKPDLEFEAKAGDIVEVTPYKSDSSKIFALGLKGGANAYDAEGYFEYTNSKEFKLGGVAMSLASTKTVVKVNADDPQNLVIEPIDFGELEGKTDDVRVGFIAGSNTIVDTIVLMNTNRAVTLANASIANDASLVETFVTGITSPAVVSQAAIQTTVVASGSTINLNKVTDANNIFTVSTGVITGAANQTATFTVTVSKVPGVSKRATFTITINAADTDYAITKSSDWTTVA